MGLASNPPTFIYFDLGNVLLFFDHRRATRQMAEVSGVTAERIWDVVFAGGLNEQLDAGQRTTAEFYEEFCRRLDCRPDPEALALAASDIFELNYSMNAVLGHLAASGKRLGLLSNTCDLHWQYFGTGRYWFVPEVFQTIVLSYRLKMMKPDRRIFLHAAEMAGVRPEEIFYVDDMPQHVAGARAVGIDAVQYTTTAKLVAELAKRGVQIAY
jgi:putative hydrolase of the HAD superfamily